MAMSKEVKDKQEQEELNEVHEGKDVYENKKAVKKEGQKTEEKHSGEKKEDKTHQIEELGQKLAEINDKYLRLSAEFDNYRKRTLNCQKHICNFSAKRRFSETQTEGVEFREVSTMEEVMPELDILYMTRVQKERFLDEEEFNRVKDSFVLDPSKLRTAKPDMIVLHPLPRVNEITRAVDNDPRVAYFRQVENGKFVRMALIYTLLKWAEGEKLAAVPDLAEGMFIDRSMKCPNSRCISATEDVDPLFVKAGDTCRCAYCEAKIR